MSAFKNNNRGFTLIELILVIAILGILAIAAAPTFQTLLSNATSGGGRGGAGAVQSAIVIAFAGTVTTGTPAWPTTLDSAANGTCSSSNPCFSNVLSHPVISSYWSKAGQHIYNYSANGIAQIWTYNPVSGSFTCAGSDC